MNVLAEVVIFLTGASFVALAGIILADAVAEQRAAIRHDPNPRQTPVRAVIHRVTSRGSRRSAMQNLIEHSKAA